MHSIGFVLIFQVEARSSFDVACQAIDIIIPHIKSRAGLELTGNKRAEKEPAAAVAVDEDRLKQTCLTVVRTFVDASSDMAPHRFRTFMNKLITNLDENEYLSIFSLLYLKADSKRRIYTGQGNEIKTLSLTMTEKHQHLFDLYATFSAEVQVRALLDLLRTPQPPF